MRAKELIQAIIGAGGLVLYDITVNVEMNEIDLDTRLTKGSSAGTASAIEKQCDIAKDSLNNNFQ